MSSTTHPTEKTALKDREKLRIERKMKSLRSLLDDDIEEQKETFSYLKKAINKDRTSARKRFSP